MDHVGIEIGRDWAWGCWEDEGWVSANDGSSQSKINTDWGRDQYHLYAIGKALRRFPKRVPSQYSREIRRIKGDSPYFVLRAHADNPEHVLLEITIENRTEGGEHRISFIVEPSSVRRLGELLLEFSKWERHSFKYHILRWSPNPDKDELVEFELSKREQPKVVHPKLDPAMKEWERLKRKHPTPEERERKKGWIERLISRGPSDWWNFPHV